MTTLPNHLLSFLFVLIIIGTILVVITDERDSGKKIAWILVISFLPVVGIVLYIMFGFDIRRTRLFNTRRRNFLRFFHSRADGSIRHVLFGDDAFNRVRPEYQELARLLSKSNGTSVTANNDIEIITSGKRKFEALTQDIRNARHHIHVEYFLFKKDKSSRLIKKLLMQKAREGVKVRFIYENIANINIRPHYFKEMKNEIGNSNKVLFSIKPVSNVELDKLVASAKIGIATYSLKHLGYRAENMGLAAGKIGNYLKCGVPVIATKVHSLSYIEDYHCGILIDNFDEINSAVKKIIADYDNYVTSAYRCYNELWHPKNYLDVIYKVLAEV